MNPLKLQILLGAVDKLTAPLKAVSGQSRLTAKDLVDTKKKIRDIETQAGQIEGYKTLGAQIGATKAKLKQAEGSFSELQRKIADTPKPTRLMINELNKAEKALNQLKTKEGEMITRHAQMGEAMRKSGINTSKLSETQRRLKTDLAAANTVLDSQRAKLGQLADQQKRLNQVKASYRQTQELRGQIAGHGATAIAAGTAIGMPVYSAIKEYSSFEDAMKGVAKQVDGARDDSGKLTKVYFDMAKEIQAIAEEIPQLNGAIDIAALVEGAARMGVQGQENLLQFARTSAKAATAFELPAGQLAEDMGKIANLYKIPIGNIEELGDAINYLDDNAQSKGADIIDVLQRLGGVADKLDFRKAAALGSTFLSLGAAPEIAASASNAMVRELSIATMQSKRFQAGMKAIGMQSTAVEKAMATDAMGTIIKVLEKIKKLNVEDQLRVTTQIFGKEYGKDAAKLSNNLDELYRQLKLVNAEKSRGSMQRESDIDKDSLSSQWLILQAGIKNVKADLGEKLRGSLMDIIKYIKQVVVGVRHWVEENPELANTLVRVAAVTSVIAIAMGGLALGVAALLGPMAIMKLTFGILGVKGTFLGKVITLLLAPLKWLTLGIFRMGMAMLTTPVGWFIMGIAAIAGGAYLIYKNWDGIAKWFSELWAQCKAPALAFWELLKELFSWTPIGMLIAHWNDIWAFFDTLPDGAVNKGKAIVQGLLDGITAKWKTLMEKVKEFTKYLPDWFTGGNVTIGQDKSTGPGYLTGNLPQPALAGASGYGPRIVPTPVPKPVAAKGGNTTTTHQWTIVQQPGETPDDLVRKIDQRIEQRERQAAARGRATLGDRN
ncbi:phage tail tape measure protein [Aeromonas hydrophila]|uniref:phage tail tape measure protein n=1 Tax=Aeromonas hydrophila TaxID=644 RepID=UPI0038D224B6